MMHLTRYAEQRMNRNRALVAAVIVAVLTVFIYLNRSEVERRLFFAPAPSPAAPGIKLDEVAAESDAPTEEAAVTTVVAGLEIPWETVFLPNGDLLVTERPGRLTRTAKSIIDGVKHRGEGGLLGAVLHPDFETNQWIYLYMTTGANDSLTNRVVRFRLHNDVLSDETMILENIPGAIYHDGGRMKFGPDGKLYVTTGDATQSDLAQDLHSLAGKILRMNDDGSVPSDNPFGTYVWSLGHRNPQGLAWDDRGRLWSTEHGRSGAVSGYDELNLIEKGKNYGWPVIEGPATKSGMESPALQSGADDTWAPASAAYWNGRIFFGGLRGESLYEADITVDPPKLKQHFHTEFGRIRNVVVDPTNTYLYITTSNRDGRGKVRDGDDKVIRISLKVFSK